MADCRFTEGNKQMNLGYFLVSKSKKAINNYWGLIKRTQSQLKWVPAHPDRTM